MTHATRHNPPSAIPGTYVFDGAAAMKGYALSKKCYSFNHVEMTLEACNAGFRAAGD